ncbi:MAG: DUF4236 domain-containing protein [Prevotella sp.]|nr:DUF4236 domain-containing protein [Prevotella sp.]
MGWRYRKRIKLLPGIHLNISKSGISTNIGIKGASVTFGSNGTYVNTGIPGTGLYQRDRITEKETSSINNVVCSTSLGKIVKGNNVYPFKSVYFFYYLFSLLVLLIGALLVNSNTLNIFFSYLIIGCFHVICILNIDYSGFWYSMGFSKRPPYQAKERREIIQKKTSKEKYSHLFGSIISLTIAICAPLILFLNESLFLKWFMHHSFGGCITIVITFTLIYGWIEMCISEAKQFRALNNNHNYLSHTTEPVFQRGKRVYDDRMISKEENYSSEPLKINKDNVKAMQNVIIGEDTEKVDKEDVLPPSEDIEPYDPKLDLENYHYPTLDLLKHYEFDGRPYIDMKEQYANKNRIVELLRDFAIEISFIKATVGPRITLYEIKLVPGINVSRIRGLEDNIALALYSHDVRIIAPIPGKGTIGIEVPNTIPHTVSMESILNSKKFQESTMELPCAIGKAMTNEVFMFDLTKTPHLLISGSTGQGKSVLLNVILTSLLYKKHPAEMKLVLMDSMGLELGLYQHIANHFLAALPNTAPIVTNCSDAVRTLKSLCIEMDARNELIQAAGERNIKDYNRKFIARRLNPARGHKFMPYIVVAIDEYGDWLMEAGEQMEQYITRLAKYARPTGIHLILTTQRPTNDVITGIIKANFPTRISLRVPERIDSQVILDCEGAEELLGNGDMLYRAGKTIDCIRIQSAFIDTTETQDIIRFISHQQSYDDYFELPDPYYIIREEEREYDDVDLYHLDPMFEDAARLIVSEQSGSTSLIQRAFSIGYNRAGRLMDLLEKAGVVGAAYGSKPREVLIKDEMSLENFLSQWREN